MPVADGEELGGEEGNGHVVAGAVDDGVDVGQGGAVGQLDGFGAGDAFDLRAWFDEAVAEEGIDLVGNDGWGD